MRNQISAIYNAIKPKIQYRKGGEDPLELDPNIRMPYPQVKTSHKGAFTKEEINNYNQNVGKFHQGILSNQDSTLNDLLLRKMNTPGFLLENPGNCPGGKCINNSTGTIAQMFGLPTKQYTGNGTFYSDKLVDKDFKLVSYPKAGDIWQKVPDIIKDKNGKNVVNIHRVTGGTNANHGNIILHVSEPDINTGLVTTTNLQPDNRITTYRYNPNTFQWNEYTANIWRPNVNEEASVNNSSEYKNKRVPYYSPETTKKLEKHFQEYRNSSNITRFPAELNSEVIEGLMTRYRLEPYEISRLYQYSKVIPIIETKGGTSETYKLKKMLGVQDDEGRSVGEAQIKLNSIDSDVRNAYGLKDQSDLVNLAENDPNKYQEVIFHVLLANASDTKQGIRDNKKQFKSKGLTEDNAVEYSLYKYQGKNPIRDYAQQYNLEKGSYPMMVINEAIKNDQESYNPQTFADKAMDIVTGKRIPLKNKPISKYATSYINDVNAPRFIEGQTIPAGLIFPSDNKTKVDPNFYTDIERKYRQTNYTDKETPMSNLSNLILRKIDNDALTKEYRDRHDPTFDKRKSDYLNQVYKANKAKEQMNNLKDKVNNLPSEIKLPGGQILKVTPQMKTVAKNMFQYFNR